MSAKDGATESLADEPPHISDPTMDDDDDFLDTTGSPVPFFDGDDDDDEEEDEDEDPMTGGGDTPAFGQARDNHLKKKKSSPQSTAGMMSAHASDRGPQGEATGRWTAEEHSLFLQGLEQHGKGWKKIGKNTECTPLCSLLSMYR